MQLGESPSVVYWPVQARPGPRPPVARAGNQCRSIRVNQEHNVSTIALSCGNLGHATRSERDGVTWFDVPAAPGKEDVDPLLAGGCDRVVVHGTDADLAAVVVRLLRRNLLAGVAVAYVPAAPSPAARLWGIPVAAFDPALHDPARPAPLIRDDVGGVLVGHGSIEPITGQVYCDDERLLNGRGLGVEVAPDPAARPLPEPTSDPLATQPPVAVDGLRASVVRRGPLVPRALAVRGLGAHRDTAGGRAVQASFEESTVTRDGVAHPRPMRKWAWYRHTEDLLLVRP